MKNPDIRLNPVIGHVVSARVKEPTSLGKRLDELADRLDIERREREMVEIEVGDVDWDDTKTVTLQKETLLEIADHYRD